MAYRLPSVNISQVLLRASQPLADSDLLPCIIGPLYQVVEMRDTKIQLPVANFTDLTIPYLDLKNGASVIRDSVAFYVQDAKLRINDAPIDAKGKFIVGRKDVVSVNSFGKAKVGDVIEVSGNGGRFTITDIDMKLHKVTLDSVISYATLKDGETFNILRYIKNGEAVEATLSAMNFTDAGIKCTSIKVGDFAVEQGKLLMSYTALRKDINGFMRVDDLSEFARGVDVHPLNPLGFVVGQCAAAAGGGREILAYVIPDETDASYFAAIDDLVTNRDAYLLVALSDSSTVQGALTAHVATMADVEVPHVFRAALTTTPLVDSIILTKDATFERPAAPITILSQPIDQTVKLGEAMTFTVVATGGKAPLSYQWFRNGNALTGATANVYEIGVVTLDDFGATFHAVVKDSDDPAATVTSDDVTIIQAFDDLVVGVQPADQTVDVGGSVTFMVSAMGGKPTLTYQWFKNDILIPGATQASYQVASVAAIDNNSRFRCEVKDASIPAKSVSSASATLIAIAPLEITTQPTDQTLSLGSKASFMVVVAGGKAPLSYQWKRDGVNIAGETGQIFEIAAVTDADYDDIFSCEIKDSSNPIKSVTSNLVTITAPIVPLAITNPPVGATVTEGNPMSFTVGTSGGKAPLSYQWKRDGIDIPGATSVTYLIDAVAAADNGAKFSVEVTDSSNPAVTQLSAEATLTVS